VALRSASVEAPPTPLIPAQDLTQIAVHCLLVERFQRWGEGEWIARRAPILPILV
jgi:hypothetical protein